MRVDLHVHTKERSACGRSTATEQIEAAIAAGLDAIAFTDHGQLAPADEVARLNKAYAPFRILHGIEFSVDGEDLIVLGIDDPAIVSEGKDYLRLHGFVEARGGLIALAHPFRYHPDIQIPIRECPPHAIEVCSNNTPCQAAGQIAGIARSLGIPVLSNSDAHATETIGRHYNLIEGYPRDDSEIIAAVKRGAFTAVASKPDGTTEMFPARDKTRA